MLEKNLEMLSNKNLFSKKVLNQVLENKNIEIITAKNDSKTAIYKDKQRSIMLHSKYNPELEARRFINNLDLEKINFIIILGFGLGYHLKELHKKVAAKGIKIFVIIEDLYLFKKALTYSDFSELFNYRGFYLYLSVDREKLDLTNLIQSKVDILFEKIKFISLPFIEKIASKELVSVMEDLKYFKDIQILNNNTVTKRGQVWERNMMENLYLLLQNPGVDYLRSSWLKKPAIIVSAGPSLNKNIELLKKAKGKAVIIAVDAVLKRLLKEDIIPDIVAVIDGYKHTLKYFEDLDYSRLKDVILITTHQFYNHVLKEWPGPLVFSPTLGSGEDFIHWVEKNSDFKGCIPTGGSVAHLAFMFAWQLDADPIVLIGQDLAFTDGITHVNGCDVQKNLEEEMKSSKRQYFKIKDIQGNDIWTRDDFKFYLDWFNRTIKKLKVNDDSRLYIDATEGGARIEGTELIPLQEVIDLYCQNGLNIKDDLLKKLLLYQPQWDKTTIKELEKEIGSIKKINQLAQRGISLVDSLIDCENQKIKFLYKIIDKLNEEIDALKSSAIFFESSMYNLYNVGDLNSNNFQLLRNLTEFYTSLITGSENAIDILERHLRKLKVEVMKR